MSGVIAGRYTAQTDEPFVVFLIGMRINSFRAVRQWLPTFRAMGPMLRTLNEHPEQGYLGGEFFLYWRGVALLQFWRSFEDLETFARDPQEPHLSAWRRFNQVTSKGNKVGVWHETYRVEAGASESVYANMPRFGLGAVMQHVPAVGNRETARRRMGGMDEPAVPTPSSSSTAL